jgi:energy-coupling factor transporter ATP-binding protein EcfA2
MRLKSITYVQHKGEPEEWRIKDFSFDDINLVVGKNATGKSRTISVIKALGNLVSGVKLTYKSGNYEVIFDKAGEELRYFLEYKESKVVKEKLQIGSDTRLDRGKDGGGKIWAVEEGKDMKFQAPPSELACVSRRDEVQHPFFDDLYKWGKNLRCYLFGTPLGKDYLTVSEKDDKKEDEDLDLKNTNQTVAIFRKGQERYGKNFMENVKADMAKVGYDIDNIRVGPPNSLTFTKVTEQLQCILVKESDLKGMTDQNSISQGMFRALSLVIQLNYSLLASEPSCILIDDIGEGLDYERSSALIKLLIDKAKKSQVQLIMSTNDRFVMNNVPLEYWSVMTRFPNESKIYNYRNSKKRFEDFELTGLNNFDFFTSESFEEKCSQG